MAKPKTRTVPAWVCLGVLGAAVFLPGCASMTGLKTQATVDDPNRLAATASLAGTPLLAGRLAGPRLVGRLWRSAAHRAGRKRRWPGSPRCVSPPRGCARPMRSPAAAESALYPQVNLSARTTRQRFSENGLVPRPLGRQLEVVQ